MGEPDLIFSVVYCHTCKEPIAPQTATVFVSIFADGSSSFVAECKNAMVCAENRKAAVL